MDLSKITAGRAPPGEINVVVEIPQGGLVKYEFDPDAGVLVVDRFLGTAMVYPGNYGFVPHSCGEDGDPLDVLILAPAPVEPGAVVPCRPIAVLIMEDDKGGDDKIIAVPLNGALEPDLADPMRDQIAHFFEHYKDLDPGRWSKIVRWGDAGEAERVIAEALVRAGPQSDAR